MTTMRIGRHAARHGLAGAILACCLALGAPAWAQQASPSPTESTVMNLIRLLVQQGVITQASADSLIKQAQDEAAQAKAASAAPTAPGANLPPAAPGVVRVPYVPEVVKNQIRDEVRQEVIQQAQAEHWASPNLLPDWLDGIEINGDFRVRDEFDVYGKDNATGLIDYATFNSSGPTDINDVTNPNGLPLMNTRTNRPNNFILRARLGLTAKVSDEVTAGVRIATGRDNGPVSTNQILGGGFGKKDLWLDLAYVNIAPTSWAQVSLGRMLNPFVHTDLVYDDDLNFDGAAASLKAGLFDDGRLGLAATAGAFPIEYSAANFPTISVDKAGTKAKWLYGGQLAADLRVTDDVHFKLAGAYYDFNRVQGQISTPCALYNGNKQCSSDTTRPAFMQKGNTLILLRNIQPDPSNPLNFAQPQFVGLAFDYNLLDLNAGIDWKMFGQTLTLQGNYVRNLGYKASQVCANAPNGLPLTNVLVSPLGNPDPCSTPPPGDAKATFQSGPNAWMVKASFGTPKPSKFGEWNIAAGYRYTQPDAVVDGFNDSDFHLGGTNAKGYFVSGSLGLYKNTWLTARWMSSNEVYGPPLAIDVGQIDLNVGF